MSPRVTPNEVTSTAMSVQMVRKVCARETSLDAASTLSGS